jgi:hypothetical protein
MQSVSILQRPLQIPVQVGEEAVVAVAVVAVAVAAAVVAVAVAAVVPEAVRIMRILRLKMQPMHMSE